MIHQRQPDKDCYGSGRVADMNLLSMLSYNENSNRGQ